MKQTKMKGLYQLCKLLFNLGVGGCLVLSPSLVLNQSLNISVPKNSENWGLPEEKV